MRDDCRSFQTSACSRPPPPRTRTFIARENRLGVQAERCQTTRRHDLEGKRGRAEVGTHFWPVLPEVGISPRPPDAAFARLGIVELKTRSSKLVTSRS